jgi:hypothetical protein
MMKRSLLSISLVAVATTSACEGCNPVELTRQPRKIAVDACTGQPQTPGKGGTTECSVAFNQSDLTVRTRREITLSNVGEQELTIKGYEFRGGSDPAFSVEFFPDKIKTGISSKMVVTFRPLLESEVSAELLLKTDAQNATNPGEGEVLIKLNGSGVDNGVPNIKVDVLNGEAEEACCDLGLVPVGSIATCRVRVTNTGTRDLVLDEIAFDPANTTSGVWTPVGALPTPGDTTQEERFTIHPADKAEVAFRFLPTDLTTSRARINIKANAPRACGPVGQFAGAMCNRLSYADPCPAGSAGTVSVDFRGQGASPPTCVAKILSVNGSTTFDPRLIEPLDDVMLTAEDSAVSVGGLTITGYAWEIRSRPQGSTVHFDSAISMTPRFVFDNTSTNQINGLDVVGDYEVRCVATDSQGTKSVNEGQAILVIKATPSEAIHLQLVWDAPETDVDLHMLRDTTGSGSFSRDTGDDCYYGNCKSGGFGSAPIWDSANPAHEGGNPVLDVDDVEGYGPENSNIVAPVPGRYQAAVHYFSDHGNGETVATLRVYIYGNLVAEYYKLIADGDWWKVGIVEWPATGGPTWTEQNVIGP